MAGAKRGGFLTRWLRRQESREPQFPKFSARSEHGRGFDEALKRIARAVELQSTDLDLGGLRLTDVEFAALRPKMVDLGNLRRLFLGVGVARSRKFPPFRERPIEVRGNR